MYVITTDESLSDGTKAVLSYLESRSKTFENGFLSHSKITDITMKSVNEGYNFFTRCLDQVRSQGNNLFVYSFTLVYR